LSLFQELTRRNVFRVGIAYVVAAWLLMQVTDVLTQLLDLPDVVGRVVVVLALGFIPALVFSRAYEITPEGLKRDTGAPQKGSLTHLTARKLDQEAFFEAHKDMSRVTERLQAATPAFERALAAARVLKADAAGHVVLELAAGMRPETRPGATGLGQGSRGVALRPASRGCQLHAGLRAALERRPACGAAGRRNIALAGHVFPMAGGFLDGGTAGPGQAGRPPRQGRSRPAKLDSFPP
jgi:hypothetical protein